MEGIWKQNQQRIQLFKRQRIQSLHSKSIPYRMPLSTSISHSEDDEFKDMPSGVDHLYDLRMQNTSYNHNHNNRNSTIVDVRELIRLKNKSRGKSAGMCLTPNKQSPSACYRAKSGQKSPDLMHPQSMQSNQTSRANPQQSSASKPKQLIKLTLYQQHLKDIKSNRNMYTHIQPSQAEPHCCPFLQIFNDDPTPQDQTIQTVKSRQFIIR